MVGCGERFEVMETSEWTELQEAHHFAGCWAYPLGQAVVGRLLSWARRAAAVTNLGFSSLSLPGRHTLTTPGSLFVVLSKLGVETRIDGQLGGA